MKMKIKYCVNHDDLTFLIDHCRETEKPDKRLIAVFMDAYYDGTRQFNQFGVGRRKRKVGGKLVDWIWFEPIDPKTGEVRAEFYYDPKEVMREQSVTFPEVCESIAELSRYAVLCNLRDTHKTTIRILLPHLKVAPKTEAAV